MKKIIGFIVILICFFILNGCSENQKLSKEEELYIKTIYASRRGNLSIEDVNIKYYLGEYEEAHVAIIENDFRSHWELELPIDVIFINDKQYNFGYDKEIISVYYQNEYYYLDDEFLLSIFTEEDIKNIHKEFLEKVK